jgi:zinc protease
MVLSSRHAFGPALAVEKHVLDNGLAVLLLQDRSAPVVSYHTWYRVGSRHELRGKTGIAHLFEHLMFNQIANLAAGEFDRMMETAGGETNAATWVDWTYYRDSLPASQLELAVRLESDRMANLTLTAAQVSSEIEVVANERRYRVDDDVEGFLSEELFKLAFEVHPYHHPTIGWMDDIMGFTPDDCLAFYRTYYAPNNAVVVLAGDFQLDAARALIERAYGALPAAKLPDRALPAEPPQRGERRATFEKPVAADRVVMAWKTPQQGHPDWLVVQAINELLTGSPSARLYRRLVVVDETASSVQGMVMPFHHPGLCELLVTMKRGQPAAVAEAVIDDELDRLRREPISDAELGKIKSRVMTDFWSELETADGKAEALGHHEATLGDYRRLFDVAPAIDALTADDVQRVARAYFVTEARTVVVAEPSGEDGGEDGDE